jgi:hypothetical protein
MIDEELNRFRQAFERGAVKRCHAKGPPELGLPSLMALIGFPSSRHSFKRFDQVLIPRVDQCWQPTDSRSRHERRRSIGRRDVRIGSIRE